MYKESRYMHVKYVYNSLVKYFAVSDLDIKQ